MDKIPHDPINGLSGDTQEDAAPPAGRPFTFASLGIAVAICVGWWVVAVAAFFIYANGQSDTLPAAGCVEATCPSQRAAMLTLGYFGLLPTAFVGVLASMVVLVYLARSLRVPWLLGTLSAVAGMLLGAIGFVTIATYDVTK